MLLEVNYTIRVPDYIIIHYNIITLSAYFILPNISNRVQVISDDNNIRPRWVDGSK